jgi:hypothetical protein
MDGSWDNMNYRKNWKYKYMVGQHELSQKPRVRLYGRTTWTPQKPRVRLHDGTTRTLTKAESKTTWWDNTRYNNVTLSPLVLRSTGAQADRGLPALSYLGQHKFSAQKPAVRLHGRTTRTSPQKTRVWPMVEQRELQSPQKPRVRTYGRKPRACHKIRKS